MIPELKTKFTFYVTDGAPYFGAYRVGTLKEGEPAIMINMESIFWAIKDDPTPEAKLERFKDLVLSTLTHEFCHAMQEYLDKTYDELEVERILGEYNESWNVFEAEPEDGKTAQDEAFRISDFLDWMGQSEATTLDEFKGEINRLFMAEKNWIDAERKFKQENPAEMPPLSELRLVWRENGKAFGYPRCCIDEFCERGFDGGLNTDQYNLVNRSTHDGFIPCKAHAKQIVDGEITIQSLINKPCQ